MSFDIGLPQFTAILEAQDFDGAGLAAVTDAELRELGISAMGHRKIILREAAKLSESSAGPVAIVDAPSAPATTPRGRVFLSYGHDPACVEIVQRIQLDLQASGWQTWVDDKRITFGDDWHRGLHSPVGPLARTLAWQADPFLWSRRAPLRSRLRPTPVVPATHARRTAPVMAWERVR